MATTRESSKRERAIAAAVRRLEAFIATAPDAESARVAREAIRTLTA